MAMKYMSVDCGKADTKVCLKNEDGSVCYVLGVRKAIRQKLGKADGDTIRVTVEIRED